MTHPWTAQQAQDLERQGQGLTSMLRMRVVISRLTATLYSRWLNHHLMRYSLHSCRARSAGPRPCTTQLELDAGFQPAALLVRCREHGNIPALWLGRILKLAGLSSVTLQLSCSSQ